MGALWVIRMTIKAIIFDLDGVLMDTERMVSLTVLDFTSHSRTYTYQA